MTTFRRIAQALIDFVYPPFCLHCRAPREEGRHLLCASCFSQVELIDPFTRCPSCFIEKGVEGDEKCRFCHSHPPPWNRGAAACDYAGPIVTLVKDMKYSNHPYLAEVLAPYLVAQFFALDWPLPDLIIPIPISIVRWLQRGYNQSELLAQQLSRYLSRPILNCLQRRSGDYSQAGLFSHQRRQLKSDSFSLVEGVNIQDQTVLLIDDVMTTGTTLLRSAETLLEGVPKEIYVLTLCRTNYL